MSFNYIKAIKRPFTDFRKLLLGMVFLVIPVVNILTSFFVAGYKLETAKLSFKKKYQLPKWEKFTDLFVHGLLSFVIALIYMLPAIILILISVGKIMYQVFLQYGLNQGLSTQNQFSDSMIQNFLLTNTALIPVFFIGILLMVLAAYVSPIAIMKYIGKYNFKDAFKLKEVFRKAFRVKYLLAVLAILLYWLIISLITGVFQTGFSLITIPILPIVLYEIVRALGIFIVGITTYTIYGEVYPQLKK